MANFEPIPTITVWDVFGKDLEGSIKYISRFNSKEEAILKLKQLYEEDDSRKLVYSINKNQSIVSDKQLPTPEQIINLCRLMQDAFVVIRKLSYEKKNQIIIELTDLFHNLPVEMFQEDRWDWNEFEAGLRDLEEKYSNDLVFPFSHKLRVIREIANS